MASFTLTTNTRGFLTTQMKKRTDFMAKAIQLIQQETLYFIARIQRDKMSFPRSGPVQSDGTRVQTGMLRRNWFQSVVAPNQTIKAQVWSTTPYAPFQSSRLKIGEAWMQDFLPKMRDAINTAFAQTMGSRA